MVYRNEEGIACTGCAYRHTRPGEVFGHTRCSVHRRCTGSTYWEPSNCQHCQNFEIGLKDLDQNTRYAQMGKIKGMLEKVQTKVGELTPPREWHYLPIYSWIFAKFNFSQPDQVVHTDSPTFDGLRPMSPVQQDTLQINNEDDDLDYEDQSEPESIALGSSGGDSNNLLDDFCTPGYCSKGEQSAQCQDPVHQVQLFLPHEANNTPVIERAACKRPLSQDIGNVVPIYSTSSPTLGQVNTQQQIAIPPATCITDPYSHETWIQFDNRIHTPKGINIMAMKSICPTTGFAREQNFPVSYKTDKHLLFQVTKTLKPYEVWIDNQAAYSSYSTSLGMPASTSALLSGATHLDSHITDDSGVRCALLELLKLEPEITRMAVSMKEDEIRTYFTDHSKMFSTHTFINFVTGFPLSNQEFARFAQEKPINIREFEADLGSFHGGFTVPTKSLNKEMEDRQNLIHTMSTLHLMEQFVLKVEKVSEQERHSIKLCPKTGRGICKRLLVNLKHDTIKWMMSKLAVRKSLLPNATNFHVLAMLRSSLWGPSLFPKEAFEELKAKNQGKNLETVLGIKSKIPIEITNTCAGTSFRATEPIAKKQKTNWVNNQVFQSQLPQNKQGGNNKNNKRGSRGGNRNRRGKNNYQSHKNNGNNNGKSNQNRHQNNRNNNQGKPFQKGKQESNQ